MVHLRACWVMLLLFHRTCSTERHRRFSWVDSARLPDHVSSHVISITDVDSLVTCGGMCTEQDCKSFHYDQPTCTLYDIFAMYKNTTSEGKIFADTSTTATAICQSRHVTGNMLNVALHKPTSIHPQYDVNSVAYLATDGDLDPIWPCAGSLNTANSYLTVDLQTVYDIYAMYYLNRQDCCTSRRKDVSFQVAETSGDFRTVVFHPSSMGNDCHLYMPPGTRGRWVRMQMAGYLTVCELEVYIMQMAG